MDNSDTSIDVVLRHGDLWPELQTVINTLGQKDWADFEAPWHEAEHFLVARRREQILGFLRYIVQPVGPELDRPAFEVGGRVIREAKVLAFGVLTEYRRQGLGRALQEQLITNARTEGLFQIRSHSGGGNVANHQLKLSLGYVVVPIVRGEDRFGAYFVLPLP